MQQILMARVERMKHAVKNWWLLLLLGIAVFGTGIFIFAYPGISYVAMAMTFAVLVLISGIVSVVVAASNTNPAMGKGWIMAGGIIEILLGLLLIIFPVTAVASLPFFLGFWLLFRSFRMIGVGANLTSLKVSGGVWTIIVGVLLLICSVMILAQPFLFGVEAVVIWVGVSFVMAGIAMAISAFQLKGLHRHFEE